LPTGLTVLVLEQHALPLVQIHALIKAGSAQDPAEKAGLANLVASLLDEGTGSRTAKQIADQIEFVGGTLAAQASEDFTTASARVLKKDTELGFELLADILRRPAFPEAELKRVRSEILGEIATEKDDPGQVAAKVFNELVFEAHPYRWPVNGTEATVPKITGRDILIFFLRQYRPNQTILTIVGAVTVMNYILGAGGFSSRLMDSIRDNQGLAYGVGSHFEANLMPGAFFISLQTRNETANQAIAGVLTELNGMRNAPVTDEELADAKAYLIGSFPLRLDTTAKLAEVLSLVEFYGLGLDYFTQYPRWIERVTKEDVLRVAKQYLRPSNYALVVVGNLAKAKVTQKP